MEPREAPPRRLGRVGGHGPAADIPGVTIRWGIILTVVWAIVVLLSFTPPQASAHERGLSHHDAQVA